MALTASQLAILKASILADPVLSVLPNTPDDAFFIADAYNAQATPDFYVWRSAVQEVDIINNGLDFTQVDGLAPGKRDEWSNFLFKFGSCNPAKPNVRAGIIDVWSGTVAKNAVQLNVFGHCQKRASRAEKLFATGAGTAAIVGGTGPATTAITELITYTDVLSARNLP